MIGCLIRFVDEDDSDTNDEQDKEKQQEKGKEKQGNGEGGRQGFDVPFVFLGRTFPGKRKEGDEEE